MNDDDLLDDDRPEESASHVGVDPDAGAARRRLLAQIAIGAVIVLALVVSYLLPRFLPSGRSAGGDPEAVVRATVKTLRSGQTKKEAYERYFKDKVVAQAIADAVKKGAFPKGLDIAKISAQTASDAATVTVKWNMKRPQVKENGTAFALTLVSGRWLIVDAAGKQVP